jgi:hypothetical protein
MAWDATDSLKVTPFFFFVEEVEQSQLLSEEELSREELELERTSPGTSIEDDASFD